MADENYKRRLTAILSADVAGYSRLMGDNEAATVSTLKSHRRLITEKVQAAKGRVIDSPGDNVLAAFGSIVDAVSCAVEIQNVLKEKNDELSEDRKMAFRIGVNLGDVIQDGDRIYGDGVNIAARIEGLADPGGVAISGTAFDNIRNKLDYGYRFSGEHAVKNIANPVRVYKVLTEPEFAGKVIGEKGFLGWMSRKVALAVILALAIATGGLVSYYIYLNRSGRIEPASVEKMAFPLPESPSILVLPLKTINSEQNHGYLADGITENIIINLSKIPSIFVIAPRSSFAYKDKSITFKQVAEELGIRYILDGGIQRSGNHIRVNAQLIDALTGVTKWAERYDRELKEVFELQDDITQKVVTALEVTLAEGEQARYRRGQTKNSKAYEYYIKGLEHYRRFTPQDNNEALRLFEKAVALDSEYYHAMADIGWAELNNWRFRWGDNPDKSLLRAEETSTAILKVDPEHSTANALRGTIYRYKGKFDWAIKYGRKAVETEPNGSDITATLATTLMYAGQAQESFELIERAIRLSPKYPSWYLYTLGAAHRQLGNYDKAVAAHEMWQKRNNRSPNPYLALVYTYTLAGMQDDAERAASEFLKKRPKFSVQQWSKSAGYADPHEVSKIERALLAAGLPE